ncbi:MAG: preprotein translocase subunit SecE [Planctomycetota bacterium]|jgi:preprotein translocase SecE subunit
MRFNIYKRGQGKYTRLCSAFGFGVIAALGCLELYKWLQATGFGLNPRLALWVATMVPAGLLVALSLFIFWLVNKQSVADFMIAAEGEVKKVSWSSKKEVAVSTFVVIVVVILMAVLLGTTDLVFHELFRRLLK